MVADWRDHLQQATGSLYPQKFKWFRLPKKKETLHKMQVGIGTEYSLWQRSHQYLTWKTRIASSSK
jgi:hypothetical protein